MLHLQFGVFYIGTGNWCLKDD